MKNLFPRQKKKLQLGKLSFLQSHLQELSSKAQAEEIYLLRSFLIKETLSLGKVSDDVTSSTVLLATEAGDRVTEKVKCMQGSVRIKVSDQSMKYDVWIVE